MIAPGPAATTPTPPLRTRLTAPPIGAARTILFVDFCGVRDKHAFLERVSARLHPHWTLVLLDAAALRGMTARSPLVAEPLRLGLSGALAAMIAPPHPRVLVADRRLFAERGRRTGRATRLVAVARLAATARRAIRRRRPALAVVWNAFHPRSRIARAALAEGGVPTIFAEYGLLPGTIQFDGEDQMAGSLPARFPDAVAALPLSPADIADAAAFVDRVRETRAGRRPPPGDAGGLARLRERAGGRPVILFAGHNAHASGCAAGHPALFPTVPAAAAALRAICRRQGWHLAYRPHPFARRRTGVAECDVLTVVEDGALESLIDGAAVVTTIFSQSAYVALIRARPVVLLGRMPLCGSGAAATPESRAELSAALADAVRDGMPESRRLAFLLHVARLRRYYLYDYAGEGAAPRGAEAFADVLRRAAETGTFEDLVCS